jgi:HEAT repeat protein
MYEQYYQEKGQHDLELLHQLGLMILAEGCTISDPEVQLMTIFGAGVSLDERASYILDEGLSIQVPNVQLISLNFIAKNQNSQTIEAINRALTSPFFQVRLEAVYQLAMMKHPTAVGQTESLMQKVPPELFPIFPQLFAIIGNQGAMKILQRLLVDADINVRVEAIRNIAKYHRDDLLPQIRTLATHHHVVQLEACATALGELRDNASIPRLRELTNSSSDSVQLAALKSLHEMEQPDARNQIVKLARNGNPFAISLLGTIPEAKSSLYMILKSQNLTYRANAALALLELKDPACLPMVSQILIKDSRDLVCGKALTPGRSLSAWKITPSGRQNLKNDPIAFELSLNLREQILVETMNLPEKDFLYVANLILENDQNDLVPTLVKLLGNLQTPNAIALLKKHREKVGSPLIRNYCNLALFRLKEPGPYADSLREWIESWQDQNLIQLRPYLPWELRDVLDHQYQINAHDVSRLLVESFEAFAQRKDDKGIEILLQAIQYGNPKNKYALAGLLMLTAQ